MKPHEHLARWYIGFVMLISSILLHTCDLRPTANYSKATLTYSMHFISLYILDEEIFPSASKPVQAAGTVLVKHKLQRIVLLQPSERMSGWVTKGVGVWCLAEGPAAYWLLTLFETDTDVMTLSTSSYVMHILHTFIVTMGRTKPQWVTGRWGKMLNPICLYISTSPDLASIMPTQ